MKTEDGEIPPLRQAQAKALAAQNAARMGARPPARFISAYRDLSTAHADSAMPNPHVPLKMTKWIWPIPVESKAKSSSSFVGMTRSG